MKKKVVRTTTLILTWVEEVELSKAHELSRKIATRLSANPLIESAQIIVTRYDTDRFHDMLSKISKDRNQDANKK
jgi:hypothetical protein